MLDLLRDAGEPVGFTDLRARMDVSRWLLHAALRALVEDGRVSSIGRSCRRRYVLSTAAPATDANPLRSDRVPGTVEEAESMAAYNERILATSRSADRRHRAERKLANIQPHLERLRSEEAERLRRIAASAPPASSFEGQLQRRVRERDEAPGELETVWDGAIGRAGKALTDGTGLGSSLGGADFVVRS